MGTLVSAVCHGTDVAYFDTMLLPYKRYFVSDAYVKPVKEGYEVSSYQFSWTLYNTAVVQPLEETVPPMIPYDFQFKKFSEMFKYADRETPINIKGLVLAEFPEKKVGKDSYNRDLIAKDFVVVDTENIPMVMRLWKEKLNELSLSSRLNSIFLKDPLVDQASALKEWYVSNKESVDRLVPSMAYKDTNRLLPKPSSDDIIPIADAMAKLEDIKTAWIAGKLRLAPGQERFWYLACRGCQKGLKQNHESEKPCPSCDVINPVSFRCHIAVMISDESDTAYAEIYSPDAEMMIPFTAEGLKKADEEGRLVTPEIEVALENKHVICYMKYFDKLVRGAVTRKYPLTKIYRYEDVISGPNFLSEQSAVQRSTSNMIGSKQAIDLTKDDEDDVQFFTPSTKVLIEEISASAQDETGDVSTPSGCKRVLSFGDVPRATTAKIEPIDEVKQQAIEGSSGTGESPIKKTKGKLKQN